MKCYYDGKPGGIYTLLWMGTGKTVTLIESLTSLLTVLPRGFVKAYTLYIICHTMIFFKVTKGFCLHLFQWSSALWINVIVGANGKYDFPASRLAIARSLSSFMIEKGFV